MVRWGNLESVKFCDIVRFCPDLLGSVMVLGSIWVGQGVRFRWGPPRSVLDCLGVRVW